MKTLFVVLSITILASVAQADPCTDRFQSCEMAWDYWMNYAMNICFNPYYSPGCYANWYNSTSTALVNCYYDAMQFCNSYR